MFVDNVNMLHFILHDFAIISLNLHCNIHSTHIGRLARMSVMGTEVDGSNPGSSMLFP